MINEASLLYVWEQGQQQHSLNRSLLLLQSAYPGFSLEAWARCPLGQRNRLLRDVRAGLFGNLLTVDATCPTCDQAQEFEIDLERLSSGHKEGLEEPFEVEIAGKRVSLRLPNTLDLAVIVAISDVDEGRELLARRCIVAMHDDESVADRWAGVDWIALIGEALEQRDRGTLVEEDMTCARCRSSWIVSLDLGDILWAELAALARRTLRDISALAKAFGWTEHEVLAVSPWRRQQYLESVGE